jgi:hypothetical protein
MTITTNFGKVVVDTNLVPYIREKQVNFLGQNLKPYKIGKIFFDDIAVNQFSQNPGKLVLDSKKVITIERNNSVTITATDKAFQGSSNTVNTFNAIVESFFTGNNTIVLRGLSGNFDDQAQLFLENASSGIVYANCNIAVVTNLNTSDEFYIGEGIVAPDRGNAYGTVLATSGENVLYVNQNYINLNVNSVGVNAIGSMAGDYNNGDIVYQTSTGQPRFDLATFKGVVRYFNVNNQGALAIEPISGVMVANSTNSEANSNTFIWNATTISAKPLAANQYNKGYFASTTNVRSVLNTSVTINTSSWSHRSGVFANTLVPNACTVILNTTSGTNLANGNLIYFVSGTGVGTVRRVVSVNQDVAVLNSALAFNVTSNTYYSFGNFIVDEYGTLPGVFHIPSFSTFKFKTGNRVLTVTDTETHNKPDYDMRATATYAASGILKTTQRVQTTPVLSPLPEVDSDSPVAPIPPSDRTFNTPANKSPVTGSTGSTTPRIPLGDGLSQTFFTPKPIDNNSDYGIFVTSVDLFFKTKPAPGGFTTSAELQRRSTMQLPVTVKIAEVLNGYPTKNYLASKTLQAKDVKISNLPSTTDASTLTKFTFDDPVYLEPAREYAIIVGSDSPDYELFIAEIGENVLGASPTRRISEQPYAGSLFRSQNSSTWTPYQNQDLMFVINKAVFSSSGTATFNLDAPPTANIDVDRVMLISSDLKFPVGTVDYRLRGAFSSNSQQETTGVYVVPYGAVEYGTLLDRSGKPASGSFLNRRRLIRGNSNSFIMTLEMSSTNSDVSPVVNLERLSLAAATFGINNAGLQNTIISITNAGAGYNASLTAANWVPGTNANVIIGNVNGATPSQAMLNYAQLYRQTLLSNNWNVGFYGVTITNNPNDTGSGASAFAVANTDGSNSINYIVVTTTGSGYLETPTISFASGNATTNVTAQGVIAGETSRSGGNMIAKYMTREIVLEDGFESGDLRVFMDAIRPTATDIQVYYKVISGDDPQRLSDKSWRRMAILKDVYSKNSRTLVGLEYRPSLDQNLISYTENGMNYPIGGTFKSFAIKICMRTTDASIIPKIRNLRIIAVPSG